ncbi:MAG TPA: arylsulfatase [Pirellulales bacterium]|jgi:arylsulfatase A-like enzyme|nr:arylsulfatase [Pirellulales bacterium]
MRLARSKLTFSAALLTAWCLAPWAAAAPRPNIVFVLADDLAWGDVGWHNCEIPTPNIDALAASGAKLESHYVQPVCSPTRAALVTGRYPMRLGLQVGVIRPWAQYGLALDERTLAQALHEAGYETAICGKWHLGHFQPEYLPTHRGFDHQYGHYNGALDYFTHERDGGFDWHRDDQVCRDEGYTTDLVARECMRLIDARGGQPLFLYVPFNAVHSPYQATAEDLKLVGEGPKKGQTYAAMLTALDRAVGQIVAALDKQGMRENTLIVFSSDNGGAIKTRNPPLRSGKATLYEGGVRVSACASWPGHIPAGSTVTAAIHIVDWYPTLINLAGGSLAQSHAIDGLDILPVLTQGAKSPHDAILLNSTPNNGALRMGDWKLILNGDVKEEGDAGEASPAKRGGSKRAETVELFNLADDPYEKTNLADQQPEKVRELRARYDALEREAATPKIAGPSKGFKAPAVWGQAD